MAIVEEILFGAKIKKRSLTYLFKPLKRYPALLCLKPTPRNPRTLKQQSWRYRYSCTDRAYINFVKRNSDTKTFVAETTPDRQKNRYLSYYEHALETSILLDLPFGYFPPVRQHLFETTTGRKLALEKLFYSPFAEPLRWVHEVDHSIIGPAVGGSTYYALDFHDFGFRFVQVDTILEWLNAYRMLWIDPKNYLHVGIVKDYDPIRLNCGVVKDGYPIFWHDLQTPIRRGSRALLEFFVLDNKMWYGAVDPLGNNAYSPVLEAPAWAWGVGPVFGAMPKIILYRLRMWYLCPRPFSIYNRIRERFRWGWEGVERKVPPLPQIT